MTPEDSTDGSHGRSYPALLSQLIDGGLRKLEVLAQLIDIEYLVRSLFHAGIVPDDASCC
jgi:hypothetical protein